ncbi:MAG: SufD family Fe-S cluster assembly protein [Mycoplasmataceae bacterium]|jgi:Fe-S cluster assembly scaffold protein SufB|nr:SufD family Fe-S cluster assembly protein [Mycoplasmataceae bacterium]
MYKTQKIINSFDNKDVVIKQTLKENSETNIIIYAGVKGIKKVINVNFIHKPNSKLNILVNCIALKQGEISININNSVNKDIKNCVINQEVNGVVLDDTSSIKVLPTMKIANKQVIANHSINIGTVDQEKVFYLLTKGMSKVQAIKTLIDNMFDKADQKQLAKALS